MHAACKPRSLAGSRVPAHSPPRTVCPACNPRQLAMAFNQPLSWDTSRVTNMFQMFNVRCSPRPAPQPVQSHTSLRLGRPQTPCPPPTSCSSAARGRAPRPSPPLAMARAGRREAAPEALTEVCVRPRQSLWRLPVPQPATHVRGDHTYTDVRAGRRKQTSSGCGCLTSARECRSSMCVLLI